MKQFHPPVQVRACGLRLLLGATAWALAGAAPAQSSNVIVPYIDRFEAVASDAGQGLNASIPNNWGAHQPRIARFSDGTVRLLYLVTDSTGAMTWRLMKRNPTGGWVREASGSTTDDVSLLRDARDDRAYVVAWTNSVPTVYASPSFQAVKVPGAWQVLPAIYRQYTNFGIGLDGTVCVKASHELPTSVQTTNVQVDYACGKYTAASASWSWSPLLTHLIGLRHVYDYIFPNPPGLPQGMYGVATRDLYKDASNVPTLGPSQFPYVYNGTHTYVTGLQSAAGWTQAEPVVPVAAPVGAQVAPTMKLTDSFIDSKGRMFSTYYKDDPYNPAVRGLYLSVTNAKTGASLFQSQWTVEAWGNLRVFEDAKSRLWLLFTNRGNKASELRLYPIFELPFTPVSFVLGPYTDMGKSTYPYAIDGFLNIASVRGGNPGTLYVDAIFDACTTTYVSGVTWDNTKCHNADNLGLQRVFYTRIRVPD